ncbi:kinase-like domain-containing protein [Mycena rosella]|uniref:non-specific serine/threonine protein kinase n=1 Tax=Mycena rosella TaxID=1033263 RepID=A0AAD7BVB6_MYCRO|nr:kinase-like domain-containing protein [Mycena rosella]
MLTAQTTDKERKTVEKEMRIHAALKHGNILEFLNTVVVELKYQDHYVPGMYMLLELAAEGDLFDKSAPDIGVYDEVAHFYFNQLIAGMDYIHREGVCHRDLKPENLLLDIARTMKISDFGLSSVFKLKDTSRTRTLRERCGSVPYVNPELNSDQFYEVEPIDVWGVGVILYTLLAGNKTMQQIPEFTRYFRFNGEALSLIQRLMSQLAKQGAASLVQALTQSLRATGDLAARSDCAIDPSCAINPSITVTPGWRMMRSCYPPLTTRNSHRHSCFSYAPPFV